MVNALPARHKPGQGFFEHAGSKSRRGIGQVIQNFLALQRETARARKKFGYIFETRSNARNKSLS